MVLGPVGEGDEEKPRPKRSGKSMSSYGGFGNMKKPVNNMVK